MVHPDWNLFKSPIQYSGVKQMAEEYQKSKEQGTTYLSHNIVFKKRFALFITQKMIYLLIIYFPQIFSDQSFNGCRMWSLDRETSGTRSILTLESS